MNQMEYELIFSKTLSTAAGVLYILMRGPDDDLTSRRITKEIPVNEAIERLTYIPPKGSREPGFYPKPRDIRNFMVELENVGLVEWSERGDRFTVTFPVVVRGNQ